MTCLSNAKPIYVQIKIRNKSHETQELYINLFSCLCIARKQNKLAIGLIKIVLKSRQKNSLWLFSHRRTRLWTSIIVWISWNKSPPNLFVCPASFKIHQNYCALWAYVSCHVYSVCCFSNSQKNASIATLSFWQWGIGGDFTFPQPRFQAVRLAIHKLETWKYACI